MIKRRLILSGIIAISLSAVSCSNREEDDTVQQENINIKTNKPSNPLFKTVSSRSENSRSETARGGDTIEGNEEYEFQTLEPHRLQPTDPITGTDPETIDPTKPDRPK